MKNLIMGTAIMILAATFLSYQADVNLMQQKQNEVYEIAQEAANTAALEIDWGSDDDDEDVLDFSNGFIKFNDPEAGEKGTACAEANLALDSSYNSEYSYFEDTMTIILYTFSQDLTYSKYVDGTLVDTGTYELGHNMSEYADSPYSEKLAALSSSYQVVINHPSTVCIIDAGKPRFKLNFLQSFLNEQDIRICKVGMYEYKDYQ